MTELDIFPRGRPEKQPYSYRGYEGQNNRFQVRRRHGQRRQRQRSEVKLPESPVKDGLLGLCRSRSKLEELE